MGLYFRKSVSLGHGFRLNFSKRGVGISGGVKGFRLSTGPSGSRATMSIPGTGIYYTKKLGTSNTSRRTTSYGTPSNTNLPYSQTVTNSYTGESRILSAATSWELRSLVENETERQTRNELRQRQIDNANTQRETARTLTDQVTSARNEINNLLRHTLNVDDKLDWDKQLILEKFHDYEASKVDNHEQNNKPKFWSKIFRKNEEPKTLSNDFNQIEQDAYLAYLDEKETFEKKARENNAEILFLKENFELSEPSAVEKYASIILSNSQYPEFIDLDFDVSYLHHRKMLVVNCILPDVNQLPIIEKYIYDTSSDDIEERLLPAKQISQLYTQVIESIAIRTIHELFEAIYTNGVNKIIFNGFLRNDDSANIDDNAGLRCVLSTAAEKEKFISIDLLSQNISQILDKDSTLRIADYLDKSEKIEPIE